MSTVPRRVCLFVVCLVTSVSHADDSYRLAEEPGSTKYRVAATARITGDLLTPVAQGTATKWKLVSKADYEFLERRLPSGGRDARSLRSVRRYSKAASSTQVNDHKTAVTLPADSRLIVAAGRSSGVLFYSAAKTRLTRDSLDLLSSPGDNLAVAAMLPAAEVEIGEKWNPDQWVAQMLTDMEAVIKSRLTCELVSVKRNQARVDVTGHLEGASLGAASVIDLSGHFVVDLAGGYVRHFELTRKEERSAGIVSPGLKITAEVSWDRSRTREGTLPDSADFAAEPSAEQLLLSYTTPWGVTLQHDRDWHVFNDSNNAAVLRLVRQGNLVAQCNIAQITAVRPGTHTPPEQFDADIRRTLGNRIAGLEPGRVLRERPTFVYQTVARGQAAETDMNWIYYLCSAPNGQQVSLVCSVAETERQGLGKAATEMANSIRFPPPTRLSRDSG